MKKISLIFIIWSLLTFLNFIALSAQTPPPQNQQDEVVRITTNLVQLDAIVTDEKGNHVKNLSAGDFEIYQDGKLQKITGFSYINTENSARSSSPETKKTDKNAPLPPPNRVASMGGGRIITFIVDDGNCAASRVGMLAAREALEKFVNEQMLPNDLVAIYQTRAGSSLWQQYTSDKSRLLQTARRIRWYPNPGLCSITGGDFFETAQNDSTLRRSGQGTFESDVDRQRRQAAEDFDRDNQVVGSIGLMRYVIRGLDRVPGRKVVFFLSDGLPLRSRNGGFGRAFDALRGLTDMANRASVVFNSVDVRGVFSGSFIGADDDVSADGTERLTADRQTEIRSSQEGLSYLAEETGGNFYRNQNFLDKPIRQALSLEKGYYLLAYEPDDDTFKGKNFNKIEIKLKRPDLKVFSRAGFLGRTDEAAKPKKRTGDSELYEAIVAPLPRAGLNLQLTAFFGNTPTEGNFVRALLHLDGNEITFIDDANSYKKAVFDVVGVTLDEKNEVVDEFTRTHTFKIEAAAIPLIKKNGLIYSTDVPVKKAGTYNFRVALRDAANRMLGTASQMIQVPDLKKNKLFLSGLTVAQVDQNGKFASPSAVKPENALSVTASRAVPAIRQFHRGAVMAYSYTLYNAQTDKTTNQPKLLVQVNLYRDGKIISEGQPKPAELEKQMDLARINDYGYLRLNQNATPGDYALQIIVKDLQTNQTASQLIDFEVTQ